MDIATPRLRLRLMDAAVVEACLAGDLEAAGRRLGAVIPADMRGQSGLAHARLRLAEDPGYAPWSMRALLREGAMIGHLRFHSRPDPAYLRPYARDAVEFGYHVFAAHRRQGYAAEAVAAAMGWAQGQGVGRFVLTVAPDNVASQALAARFGFVRVGQQIDEVDGIEDVLLREAGAVA